MKHRGSQFLTRDGSWTSAAEVQSSSQWLLLFSCSVMSDSLQPMDCSTPGLPVPHHLPKFVQVHVIAQVMPSNHLVLCCLLLLMPSIFPSIRVFSNESALHISWSKQWSFSFSNSPSSECLVLISFRIDGFDLIEAQGTCKGLLQHHNLKASILQCSAYFMVEHQYSYMTTGKTIALTI